MAAHLIGGGHRVFLHSRSGIPAGLVASGGHACGSARDVAEGSDVIFCMVPDTHDVEAVLFGANGLARGLRPGSTVVDMSSISPLATREFAARVNQLGCGYLDAPVSGGEVGARSAALTIMVGGDLPVFERVVPLLRLMGNNVTLVGPNGAGQVCKVANQMIVTISIEAVGEALVLAAKAGADPAKVRQALMGGFASSRVLEVHGQRMPERAFAPGFRIALHRKDLRLAQETAGVLGVSIPGTECCQQLFDSCVAAGHERSDHSAMITALEARAGASPEPVDRKRHIV
jgi:2-hydroxy-3-oxopropionate reductase